MLHLSMLEVSLSRRKNKLAEFVITFNTKNAFRFARQSGAVVRVARVFTDTKGTNNHSDTLYLCTMLNKLTWDTARPASRI